jgi:nucleoside-diphosphate-sugar epimerase
MRILLIGGRGFLGKYVQKELQRIGIECISAGRNAENDIILDLLSKDSVHQSLLSIKPEIVINMAGAFENEPGSKLEVNSIGPSNLISSLVGVPNLPKLVHIGSATEPRINEETGYFESQYSRTKYIGTRDVHVAIEARQIQGKIIRVHNCYGIGQPRNRFIAWASEKLKNQEPITLMHPDRVRDFCLVEEAATAISKLIQEDDFSPESSFKEVGSGAGITLRDAGRVLCNYFSVPKSLVLESMGKELDYHSYEVARVEKSSSGHCKTNFNEGIIQTFGDNR